ncbi:hypothetical protein PACILC2_49030 [Paenibacillus cisolokensis]|uniref:Uncharacterized protein n=1 Tax=Paenibacillus cisolokensis TaxID=1658519 RepID=A0ABQ4NDR0_9BACL|nr:hypothetical protein PACILC2_49030 [Paenibacillus cisolokensis]
MVNRKNGSTIRIITGRMTSAALDKVKISDTNVGTSMSACANFQYHFVACVT